MGECNVESSQFRVLVVEDHEQTRAGVRDYLAAQGFIVQEAGNTTDALALVKAWHPHVVVLDIVIPSAVGTAVNLQQGDGIRAAWLIKQHNPAIGIVLLSNHPYYRPEVLELAGKGFGGLVYLFKGEGAADELRKAVHDARQGRIVLDPQVGRSQPYRPDDVTHSLTAYEREKVEYAVSQMHDLTDREREIVAQVAASRTNGGIAKMLHITPNAVQTHLRNIYAKAGLSLGTGLLDKRMILVKAHAIYLRRFTQSAP